MSTKTTKCEFCGSESTPELCKLSTATTIIDGKKYTACCVKCAGKSNEEKPRKGQAKQSKK
jgi:hypothetical protein